MRHITTSSTSTLWWNMCRGCLYSRRFVSKKTRHSLSHRLRNTWRHYFKQLTTVMRKMLSIVTSNPITLWLQSKILCVWLTLDLLLHPQISFIPWLALPITWPLKSFKALMDLSQTFGRSESSCIPSSAVIFHSKETHNKSSSAKSPLSIITLTTKSSKRYQTNARI